MQPVSHRASARSRSLLLSVVIGLALRLRTLAAAAAEPTTDGTPPGGDRGRRVVLPERPEHSAAADDVDPNELCVSVLVENIDPEGSNSGDARRLPAALPLAAKPPRKLCAQAVDQLLDPARAVFLDQVVPAVQQLACVTSAPAAFDCLAQQVHVWLKQSIVVLWQGLIAVLTADTEAIKIIDGWRQRRHRVAVSGCRQPRPPGAAGVDDRRR